MSQIKTPRLTEATNWLKFLLQSGKIWIQSQMEDFKAHLYTFLLTFKESSWGISLQGGNTSPSICFMNPYYMHQSLQSKLLLCCSKIISYDPRTCPVWMLKRIQETKSNGGKSNYHAIMGFVHPIFSFRKPFLWCLHSSLYPTNFYTSVNILIKSHYL